MIKDLPRLAEVIVKHFAEAQNAYGRPDAARSPFATGSAGFGTGKLHSVPFLCRACYGLFDATGDTRYRDAGDRFFVFLIAVLYDPHTTASPRGYFGRAWMYGMALDCYAEFKRRHPDEPAFDSKARAIYAWLGEWRWNRPSRFRVGYTAGPWPDNEFSDDLCHVGRGLAGYFEVSGIGGVLEDALALAAFFVAPLRTTGPCAPPPYKGRDFCPADAALDGAELPVAGGIFNETIGTWAVGPWPVPKFEHMTDVSAAELGWGFSARGVTEFLLRLAPRVQDENLKRRIAERCRRSLRWQIEECQFDGGAMGMAGRDDEWLGQTAGFLLNYLDLRARGLLEGQESAAAEAAARRAWHWIAANASEEFIFKSLGYRRVTGRTACNHLENAAWLMVWFVQLLLRLRQAPEERRRLAEDGGRKTDDGRQRTEDRGQTAEDGGRTAEDGRRTTDDRRLRADG